MGIPTWFFGANAGLEFLAMIASILIMYFAYRSYKLSSQRKFFYLGLAFFFIGISFFARTITHLLFYIFGANSLLTSFLQHINYGSPFYMLITLLGYLIILAVITKMFDRYSLLMIFLLALAGIMFSANPLQLFHIFSLIILFFILWKQLENYFQTRNANALLVFTAFLLMLVGHTLFITISYIKIEYVFYILAHVFQLLGYGALLLAMLRVWSK